MKMTKRIHFVYFSLFMFYGLIAFCSSERPVGCKKRSEEHVSKNISHRTDKDKGYITTGPVNRDYIDQKNETSALTPKISDKTLEENNEASSYALKNHIHTATTSETLPIFKTRIFYNTKFSDRCSPRMISHRTTTFLDTTKQDGLGVTTLRSTDKTMNLYEQKTNKSLTLTPNETKYKEKTTTTRIPNFQVTNRYEFSQVNPVLIGVHQQNIITKYTSDRTSISSYDSWQNNSNPPINSTAVSYQNLSPYYNRPYIPITPKYPPPPQYMIAPSNMSLFSSMPPGCSPPPQYMITSSNMSLFSSMPPGCPPPPQNMVTSSNMSLFSSMPPGCPPPPQNMITSSNMSLFSSMPPGCPPPPQNMITSSNMSLFSSMPPGCPPPPQNMITSSNMSLFSSMPPEGPPPPQNMITPSNMNSFSSMPPRCQLTQQNMIPSLAVSSNPSIPLRYSNYYQSQNLQFILNPPLSQMPPIYSDPQHNIIPPLYINEFNPMPPRYHNP
ncbi:hypothetical protein CWI38_0022p0040 [Hamiltosporidium tvaerminnensis]|uniref:Uncharacterized protein n=1 Tax=Hamiltosporidium tvaerminnensis TaxID=1176355 RepID=A0A4Q9M212_9MICR|nr:hypothetical protein CWI38_0022p0040 [Hamiltosporidium tvaerminnensis]